MIQGGWEYVIAAYSITWTLLGLYSVSLYVRLKKSSSEGDSK